jgi:phosphatidylglycerol:prolipoprotein diacylglycerol transferase
VYPKPLHLFGVDLSVWNAALVVAVALGYLGLRHALCLAADGERLPSYLPLRWLVSVYVALIAAQLCAYLVDRHTSVFPPAGTSWVRYYLDPSYGPKTLYGAVLGLPLGVAAVRGLRRGFWGAVDCWTPALFLVLGVCRVGCFLQGCCYGLPSATFGVRFATGPPAYFEHLRRGLIGSGDPALPVVPTQLMEAAALLVLAAWSLREVARRAGGVFVRGLAIYSVVRFLLEFLRDDPERNGIGVLSSSQLIALALLAIFGSWKLSTARAARRRLAWSGSPR